MRCWAISDLHVGHAPNLRALPRIRHRPDDWLIVAGDVGETLAHLDACFDVLQPRFARVLWVPGNHELYTTPNDPCQLRGVARYERMVEHLRARDVLTPEDPWPTWPGDGPKRTIALCNVLYDYTFAPDGLDPDGAREWARESGIMAADERYLGPDPFPGIEDWCAARIVETEARLASVPEDHRIVLVNHFPLRRDLVRLWRIPRFVPWCGTRATEAWHRRFNLEIAVHGHLHLRATDWRDGVRFEEVALGYPRHWRHGKGPDAYLREILPGPPPLSGDAGPVWHR